VAVSILNGLPAINQDVLEIGPHDPDARMIAHPSARQGNRMERNALSLNLNGVSVYLRMLMGVYECALYLLEV